MKKVLSVGEARKCIKEALSARLKRRLQQKLTNHGHLKP